MQVVLINNVEYLIPEVASDVTFGNYIPFSRVHNELIKFEEKSEEYDEAYFIKKVKLMMEAVAKYFNTDSNVIFGIESGDIEESVKYKVSVKNEKSLRLLYESIAMIVCNYVPVKDYEGYAFMVNGETYYLRHTIKKGDSLTVSETIEILEAQRIAKLLIPKYGKDDTFFNAVLTMMAVLCMKEGEVYPNEQSEIDSMIEERKKIFQNVSMNIALDVAFFLTSIGQD